MKPSTDASRLRESAAELAAFVQSTQPKEWMKLAKQFPGAEREMLAAFGATVVCSRFSRAGNNEKRSELYAKV